MPETTTDLEPGGHRRLVDRAHAERWERMTEVERLLDAIAPAVDLEDLVDELLAGFGGTEA